MGLFFWFFDYELHRLAGWLNRTHATIPRIVSECGEIVNGRERESERVNRTERESE